MGANMLPFGCAASISQGLSGRMFRFRQQVREGLFSFFGCHCHAFKKDVRRLYRRPPTGTVNFPFPCFR